MTDVLPITTDAIQAQKAIGSDFLHGCKIGAIISIPIILLIIWAVMQ